MPSRRTRRASQSSNGNLTLETLERRIEANNLQSIQQCVRHGLDLNAITPVSGLTPLELALKKRNTSMMQMLLDAGANTEQKNNQGTTILINAIRHGYLDGVRLLVQYGANVNACSENGKPCLLFALEKEHPSIAAYLMDQDSCELDVCGTNGHSVLQSLVLANNAALISSLENRGVNLNTPCIDGTVVLFFATKHCKNKALKALLKAGADPNIGTSDCDFALHEAIRQDNMKAVKHLMEHGADDQILNKNGLTPLDVAINRQCVPMLRLLLDNGANIEQKCANGSTPLLAACSMGHAEGVQLLVECGANMYVRGSDGMTCVQVALEKEHHSIVAYLLQHDARQRGLFKREALSYCQDLVLADDAASILRLKHGVNINMRYPDGTVLVCFAIIHCKNEALKALLEAGADPDVHNVDGEYALHEAIERNNFDAVKQLLVHSADTRVLNKDGLAPVHVAIKKKYHLLLRQLLDCGADIEQNCSQGSTPLITACQMGCMEGVQLLVERGANLKACSTDGNTCVLVALEHDYESIVDYLLDQGTCTINRKGRDGFSALHRAVHMNKTEIVHRLIQLQVDVNIQTHKGEVSVFLAARAGKVDLLRMLLEAGAVPNVDTKDGDFSLHEAVKYGDIEAVELLLQHGADRERLDKNGMTPVEVAMGLVPPPQDIIHCLLTDYMDDEDTEASNSFGHPAGDDGKISVAELKEALCCCPITFEVMKDPVIAMDGHTYEREAIEQWIRERRESPVTRQPLTSSILIPNLAIKHLIERLASVDSNA